jgi:hypothetical protein
MLDASWQTAAAAVTVNTTGVQATARGVSATMVMGQLPYVLLDKGIHISRAMRGQTKQPGARVMSLPPHLATQTCLAFDLPFCSKPPKPKPSDTFVCLGVSCLSWGGRGFCVRLVCTCALMMARHRFEATARSNSQTSLPNLFFRDLAHPHHSMRTHRSTTSYSRTRLESPRRSRARRRSAKRLAKDTFGRGRPSSSHRASTRHTTRTHHVAHCSLNKALPECTSTPSY